jgi:hypothetical protein
LFVDPEAQLHRQLNLYPGLNFKLPGLSTTQTAWLNLLLMCAGIGSPGTLAEVFRGYRGDRNAPQLIGDEEVVKAKPLPPLKGSFFQFAGGSGYQRPFELATRIARGYPFNEVRGRGIAENARGQSPKYFQSLSFYLSIFLSHVVV